jgi:hypothetical protein
MPAMPYARHLQSRRAQVVADLEAAMHTPGEELAPAALAIAGVEYPALDAAAYLRAIERLGVEAAARVRRAGARGQDAIHVLNEFLYDDQRFTGNRDDYDDPRNSFLNEVLDRRTGIPISLAVVYLEIARRAACPDGGRQLSRTLPPAAPTTSAGRSCSAAGSSSWIRSTAARSSRSSTAVSCCGSMSGDEAAFDRDLLAPRQPPGHRRADARST